MCKEANDVLFLKSSQGFMKINKWHNTVGAFITVEAYGTGGSGKQDVKFLFSMESNPRIVLS